MKKQPILSMAVAMGIAVIATGCATNSDYVDATDTTAAIKNKTTMSSSDWLIATEELSKNLLSSPLFDEYLQEYRVTARRNYQKQHPDVPRDEIPASALRPLLMLSTIENRTSEHIDTRLLTERLREVLFNSAKVRFTTYAAGAGQSRDEATAGARDLIDDPNVDRSGEALKRNTVKAYDLSLGGVIIKQKATEGKDREISYAFSLTLTNNRTGEGVWTKVYELKRQDRRGGIGW